MAKKISHYLIREIYEYLDASSFKHFLPIDEAPRETRVMELIDVLKYWMVLAWLEDMDAQEIERLFLRKTAVVDERHQKKILSSQLCGLDIDGVIARWPFAHGEGDAAKQAFWEAGGATTMQPIAGARDALVALKASGWGLVLVTARKVARNTRLEYETYQWLKDQDIPYDMVIFGYDKSESIHKNKLDLKFFVEDNPKHGLDIAMSGIPVLLLGGWELNHGRIRNISSISDIPQIAEDIRRMSTSV